eukprot:Nitzschia sp. Nitz4//scaffold130_size63480//39343//40345//NITZ4_006253-RA/size63480-processed-gene-0.19-mRNA-1//1//CDS//3329535201//569//frame0
MPNLNYVFIPGNNFEGKIPTQWTGFPKLTDLNLSYNSLTGSIPPSLTTISNLEYLSVAFNSLTGTLPSELAELESLRGLYVNNNFALGGTIPPEYLNWSNLNEFFAHGTSISGSFEMICEGYNDTSLFMVSDCRDAAVEWNYWTGTLPTELGLLTTLDTLRLYLELLDRHSLNMRTFLLQRNSWTGTLPSELGNLMDMRNFDLANNEELSGSIPLEDLSSTSLTGSLEMLRALEVSSLYIAAHCGGEDPSVQCSCCDKCRE